MRHGFVTPLRVESVDDKTWVLLEDFVWIGTRDKPDVFTVKAGETTDFASVPWWTQAILPRTGTWTKAAVLHDRMCNDLNEYYRSKKRYEELTFTRVSPPIDLVKPIKPRFTSIDTDAIFRKNARECGTDLIRAELLWFGVRCGAVSRPRRENWIKTFPRFFVDLVVILAVLAGLIAFISWAWPW